jgi:hypothetical protein
MTPMLSKLATLALVPGDVFLCQNFADAAKIGVNNVQCRQMVMRMLRLLRLCDYDTELLHAVLATALVHLDRVFRITDARMEDSERVSIAVLQCYNAHCYIVDEACPMKYWQHSIYSDYCSVKVLSIAAVKLIKILKYNLSVTEEDFNGKLRVVRGETSASCQ